MESTSEWPAWLHLDGWFGRTRWAVTVIGETPHCYRIRADMKIPIGGRARSMVAGEVKLVPKKAITKRNVA